MFIFVNIEKEGKSLLISTGDNLIGTILQFVYVIIFFVFLFYGQKLQMIIMSRDIESTLFKLKRIRDKGKETAISSLNEVGELSEDPKERVNRILEHIAIMPVDLDPAGILRRLEHIIDVRDSRFKDEVKIMLPKADEVQINNTTLTLEVALALNQIYKIVRHLYIMGKKTSSFYMILQLQMILPLVMQETEAYSNALTSFKFGQPIGDGIGALIAAKLMQGQEKKEIAKDTVVSEVIIEKRKAYILKAVGPGGNVGKPGEAVKRILEKRKGKVSMAIIVDAAGKLEGEKTGVVSEGTGVAIGGIGVEKHKVEEVATKYSIPLHAILIKQNIKETLSVMNREILDSVDVAIQRIRRLILENTKEGDTIIIAGIGNSMGVGQ